MNSHHFIYNNLNYTFKTPYLWSVFCWDIDSIFFVVHLSDSGSSLSNVRLQTASWRVFWITREGMLSLRRTWTKCIYNVEYKTTNWVIIQYKTFVLLYLLWRFTGQYNPGIREQAMYSSLVWIKTIYKSKRVVNSLARSKL